MFRAKSSASDEKDFGYIDEVSMYQYEGADDLVDAGDGDDTVYGYNGFDEFTASAGNDFFDGGNGFDILSFSGAHGEYQVRWNVSSSHDPFLDKKHVIENMLQVRHNVSGANDGMDVFRNVELLKFDDSKFVDAAELFRVMHGEAGISHDTVWHYVDGNTSRLKIDETDNAWVDLDDLIGENPELNF